MKPAGDHEVGMVTLNINGKVVIVSSNTTLLNAATASGIYIPAACGHIGLGSLDCRLCAVFVEGYKELQLACKTFSSEGLAVWTETPRVQSWRKKHLRKVIGVYKSPCLECQRVEPCDGKVCGRRNIPSNKRCSICENIKTCELRKAARHIFGVHIIFRRYAE